MDFASVTKLLLEHSLVLPQQIRVAQALRGLLSQHGFGGATQVYNELRWPAEGLRLESKFGVREPVSQRSLLVLSYVTVSNDEHDGACHWGHALSVVRNNAVELDSLSHRLCEVQTGSTPVLTRWLEQDKPVEAMVSHLQNHAFFADRSPALGAFMHSCLNALAP